MSCNIGKVISRTPPLVADINIISVSVSRAEGDLPEDGDVIFSPSEAQTEAGASCHTLRGMFVTVGLCCSFLFMYRHKPGSLSTKKAVENVHCSCPKRNIVN